MEICSKLEKKIDFNLNHARELAHAPKNKSCLSGRKIAAKVFALELMALISRIIRLPVVIVIIQPFRVLVFTTTLLTFRLIKPLNRFDSHLPGFKDIYHTTTKIPRLFIGVISTAVFGIIVSPQANFKIHCGMKLLRNEVKKPDGGPENNSKQDKFKFEGSINQANKSQKDSKDLESSRINALGTLDNPGSPKNVLDLARERGWEFTPNRAQMWKNMPVNHETKDLLIDAYECDGLISGPYDTDPEGGGEFGKQADGYQDEFEKSSEFLFLEVKKYGFTSDHPSVVGSNADQSENLGAGSFIPQVQKEDTPIPNRTAGKNDFAFDQWHTTLPRSSYKKIVQPITPEKSGQGLAAAMNCSPLLANSAGHPPFYRTSNVISKTSKT